MKEEDTFFMNFSHVHGMSIFGGKGKILSRSFHLSFERKETFEKTVFSSICVSFRSRAVRGSFSCVSHASCRKQCECENCHMRRMFHHFHMSNFVIMWR